MKVTGLVLWVLGVFLVPTLSWGSTVFFEDFESQDRNYITSIPEFVSASGEDYFTATDGSDTSNEIFTGIQGARYFAAQDIDGQGASLPARLEFSNIGITGVSDLQLSVYLAEDDDGARQDWDRTDFVSISYSIDGGGAEDLLSLRNDGSVYNSAPFIDTDFDGIGDGTEITAAFTEFSASIAASGNLLDLFFTFSLNAADEDIAVDNIRLSGVTATPVPLPLSSLFFVSGLLVLARIYKTNRV